MNLRTNLIAVSHHAIGNETWSVPLGFPITAKENLREILKDTNAETFLNLYQRLLAFLRTATTLANHSANVAN